MRCPGCGQLALFETFPPSLDPNRDLPSDDPWWCGPCLKAKVRAAREKEEDDA
jgi:hypothetical protein